MLTPDERAEMLELLTEQAAELIDLTADADAATLERMASLGPLRLLGSDAPPSAAEVFVDALETHGPAAADLLDAIATLGPPALAAQARAAIERTGGSPTPRAPLKTNEAIAVRLPGADVYLLRIERTAPAWHAAHVILEGDGDDIVLVVASMADAEPDGELGDVTEHLDPGGLAAIEPADLDEVRSRVRLGADNARRAGIGLNTETVVSLPLIGAALGLEAESVCGLVVGGAPSSLVVGPDDDDRFAEVVDDLLEDLGPWLRDAGRPVDAGLLTAEVMLTYKWLENDGDLARWTEADLVQLLLDYVPREVFVDDRLMREMPSAATDFLGFLDERALLAGEPLPDLLDTCEELAEAFPEAVASAPATGPADLLVGAMAADGVDLSDEAQVQAWISAYNAGSQADRERITGPPVARRASKSKRRATKAARKRNRRR